MLYRSMGFRIAIDDLGEGFASLRLWSELRPEFVKADKHFVTGHRRRPGEGAVPARDPAHRRQLRLARDRRGHRERRRLQGGEGHRHRLRPGLVHRPARRGAARTSSPTRRDGPMPTRALPVVPAPRLRAGTEPHAHDFVRAVDAAAPQATLGAILERFAASPSLAAIPVIGTSGVEGVVSRMWLDARRGERRCRGARGARPCLDFADRAADPGGSRPGPRGPHGDPGRIRRAALRRRLRDRRARAATSAWAPAAT